MNDEVIGEDVSVTEGDLPVLGYGRDERAGWDGGLAVVVGVVGVMEMMGMISAGMAWVFRYRLAMVLFRQGGALGGFFLMSYVALPACAGVLCVAAIWALAVRRAGFWLKVSAVGILAAIGVEAGLALGSSLRNMRDGVLWADDYFWAGLPVAVLLWQTSKRQQGARVTWWMMVSAGILFGAHELLNWSGFWEGPWVLWAGLQEGAYVIGGMAAWAGIVGLTVVGIWSAVRRPRGVGAFSVCTGLYFVPVVMGMMNRLGMSFGSRDWQEMVVSLMGDLRDFVAGVGFVVVMWGVVRREAVRGWMGA